MLRGPLVLVFEVKLQQFVRRDERADFGVEHFLLELRDAGFDLRVVVEAVLQHLSLIHI